ncbi:cytochrome P450 [Lentzea alba]|uniref:cytochrome P450 n=1 Tax=Lentzea alba TaxID=2714351 RepID=UPI0039BEDC09
MNRSFPVDRTCPFTLPADYAEMRSEAPAIRVSLPGGDAWLITRHAEAKALLKDTRVSTDPRTPGHPYAKLSADPPPPEVVEAEARFHAGEFVNLDPPEHGRFRGVLQSAFRRRHIEELRPVIVRLADDLVSAMIERGPQADLVRDFALPLPVLVTCAVLGVPEEERDFFASAVRRAEHPPADDPLATVTAVFEMRDRVERIVAAADQAPPDSVIAVAAGSGAFDRDELVGVVTFLLKAGYVTTNAMISLGVLTLCRHPAQLASLGADPQRWASAVDELLRFLSVTDWYTFDRVATEDITVGDDVIRAGDGIFVLGASINHDERVFARAGEFDVQRDARRHLAFGHGVHRCLGDHLAGAELEIALRTLFSRLPGLRITATDDELDLRVSGDPFGLVSLPVAWEHLS